MLLARGSFCRTFSESEIMSEQSIKVTISTGSRQILGILVVVEEPRQNSLFLISSSLVIFKKTAGSRSVVDVALSGGVWLKNKEEIALHP